MLNFTVPVFDMGRSCGNVTSGKCPDNVWKRSWRSLEIHFQNCVETLPHVSSQPSSWCLITTFTTMRHHSSHV